MKRIMIFLLLLLAMLLLTADEIELSMVAKKNLRSANMYFKQTNYDKAHKFYNEVLSENPDYLQVFDIGEFSNVTYLTYELDKDYPKSYHMAGEVVKKIDAIMAKHKELEETDSKEAKKYFKKNIKKKNLEKVRENNGNIQKSSWARMFKAAKENYDKEDYEAAISAFEDLYKITPDSSGVVKMLAVSSNKAGNTDKATMYFEKIVKIDPSDVTAITQLANFQFNNENYDEAAKWYLEAANLEPENANHLFNSAICYGNNDKPEKALEMYEKTIEVDPTYTEAIINASILAKNSGDDEKFVELRKKAIENDPEDLESIMLVTYTLNGMKRFDEVIKYAKMWETLEPENKDPKNIFNYAKQQLDNKK